MKQTDRVPHKVRGADEKRAGVPAQSAGVPAESAGTTKTSYPLMKYLSLLLAVALLFSGVTFARYLSNDQIDASVGIAAFDATYSIDRVNSTTFGNQDYWIDVGGTWVPQGAGTAITVGMTLRNNGDTSVQPTLHFEGPAEYWNNIALQLTTAKADFTSDKVLTPQLVIGSIFGKSGGIQTGTDGETQTGTDAETQTGTDGETQTGSSDYGDYGSLGGEATLDVESVTDGDKTTTTTATWGENSMVISSFEKEKAEYSVGFARKDGNEILPPVFVDCEKTMTYYSIDITLPALDLGAAQENDGEKKPSEQRVLVWLTWTDDVPNSSTAANKAFWKDLITEEGPFDLTEQITILGYHFDVSGVPVVEESGNETGVPVVNETGETTTVRLKKKLGSEDLEYFHVASINDTDGSYVHGLTRVEEVEGMIYKCANKVAGNQIWVNLQGVSTNLDISSITMIENTIEIEGTEQKVVYAPIQQRSYGVTFGATFVQSSESP